jgi:hypothetical protein
VDLRFIKKPQNWNIKLTRTEDISLGPFQDTSVDLTVIAPKHALAGSYGISIEATLDGDGSTEYINMTAIIERTYNFELNCAVTQYTVDPGISAKFEVEIVNDGNDVDNVNLSIIDLPKDWKTSVGDTGTTFTIDAFSSVKEIITVTSYSSGNSGEYEMEIIGTLLGDDSTDTIPIRVTVIQLFDVELDVEDDEKATVPNKEVHYNITIQNTGNGQDGIYREVIGIPSNLKNNIHFPLKHKYDLAPGQVRKETLRIFIPEDFDPGYFNLSVLIYSEGDASQKDKINASTMVEQKAKFDEESSTFDISGAIPWIILIIIILIILIAIGVVLSRRNRRRAHRELVPAPSYRAPPPPPPPRGRARRAGRMIDDLDDEYGQPRRRGGPRRRPRGRRGRGRGRRARDKVRWRESRLEEGEEPEDLDEDEEEEVYDVDAEEDKEDTDWDDEDEDKDKWLDEDEEAEEVYDMDAEAEGEDEAEWDAEDDETWDEDEGEELKPKDPKGSNNHKFLDVDWE